jgi:hypothetical protein
MLPRLSLLTTRLFSKHGLQSAFQTSRSDGKRKIYDGKKRRGESSKENSNAENVPILLIYELPVFGSPYMVHVTKNLFDVILLCT